MFTEKNRTLIAVTNTNDSGAAAVPVVLNSLGDLRNFVTRLPYKELGAEVLQAPFEVMHQPKKRGRPQIRTAEYWREYYTRKQREWRAAHPRIRTGGPNRDTQITDVRVSAALATGHTTWRE